MRDRIAAIGRVEEQYAGFAVMMRLLNDLVEQVARLYFLIALDLDTGGLGLFESAAESLLLHLFHIGEAQFPFFIVLHSAHERVGNSNGNIEVRDLILVDLTDNKVFHIRVVYTQDGHVGPAARTALCDLTTSVVVHSYESHR